MLAVGLVLNNPASTRTLVPADLVRLPCPALPATQAIPVPAGNGTIEEFMKAMAMRANTLIMDKLHEFAHEVVDAQVAHAAVARTADAPESPRNSKAARRMSGPFAGRTSSVGRSNSFSDSA